MDPIMIVMISYLALTKHYYRIKVRIIHLWKKTTWSNPHDTPHMGMILMDEHVL